MIGRTSILPISKDKITALVIKPGVQKILLGAFCIYP